MSLRRSVCFHKFFRRLYNTILVVSDTILRDAAGEELSPVSFGGIYLPLECPSSQCCRTPLVLCYDSSHFSALVTMRHTSASPLQRNKFMSYYVVDFYRFLLYNLPPLVSVAAIIPITDKNRNLLPLHFAVDPGSDFTWLVFFSLRSTVYFRRGFRFQSVI